MTPEQHRGCDCRGVGAPRQPGAPGLRVGAIATVFTAWTLLPLPTAQTQCSVLGWNTHQPSDAHEFVPVMKRKRLRRRRKKKPHTHIHIHTEKERRGLSPCHAGHTCTLEEGCRPLRGSTRGALAAREPRVPTSLDLGLLPSLHRPARTLGTRVAGLHREGVRVRGAFARGGPSALCWTQRGVQGLGSVAGAMTHAQKGHEDLHSDVTGRWAGSSLSRSLRPAG